jgi:hypothetical protein
MAGFELSTEATSCRYVGAIGQAVIREEEWDARNSLMSWSVWAGCSAASVVDLEGVTGRARDTHGELHLVEEQLTNLPTLITPTLATSVIAPRDARA